MVEDSGPAWCATLAVADDERNLFSQAYVQRGEPVYAEIVSDRFPGGLPWSAPSRTADCAVRDL